MRRDFLQFLTRGVSPSKQLYEETRKDILLSFRARSIGLRFLGYQAFGALISLLFCPQFGLGFMEGHGISHYFRMMGDWACAAFCGSLFLSSGMISAMIGMQGEELSWIWRRYKSPVIFVPAFLWGFMMLGNLTLDLPKEDWDYHLIWIVAGILIQGMIFYSYQLFKNLKVDKF